MGKVDVNSKRIPVVDLFAGPGGLGEGFARFPYTKPAQAKYDIRLSIEKNERAHETLRLRSFVRQFEKRIPPPEYYQLLKINESPLEERLDELFDLYPIQAAAASSEAICAELGTEKYDSPIKQALAKQVGQTRDWVLLGGPPCQAYSMAGRSRNKGIKDYRPEDDHRHFLYREYLKAIADHLPSVFVMENVKGLLSATVNNERIFDQIVTDLQHPRKALGFNRRKPPGVKATYRLFSLVADGPRQGTLFESAHDQDLTDFVVRMELYGIPQARHRLIVVGVRNDLEICGLPKTLLQKKSVNANDVLSDLPKLRSGLSKEPDGESNWKKRVAEATKSDWYSELKNGESTTRSLVREAIREMKQNHLDRGADWFACKTEPKTYPRWYNDAKIEGVFNHQSRGHISADLHRYLFATCYAQANGISPSLKNFPPSLLPNHKSATQALKGSNFADRFRVQLSGRPSTTIVSHISKDGHANIHPDPMQCRSLTVREAARLQTFPDNYFFCGPRTEQYIQVGNAVPPLLAHQIADIVHAVLCETGIAEHD